MLAVCGARRAVSTGQAADILCCSTVEVRRLVRRGELEGYRHGRRSVRVYGDSIAEFQARRRIVPSGVKVAEKPPRPSRRGTLRPEKRERLRALGIIGS